MIGVVKYEDKNMSEYLKGAIQKVAEDARLARPSARFIQIGCGIPIEIPAGRRRVSTVEEPLHLKLGTEKNGGLAEGVAEGKYHWAITGLETVEDLPNGKRNKVIVVKDLPFAYCQYRIGVHASAFGVETLGELLELIKDDLITVPQSLNELTPDTSIATKHVNFMKRIINQRGLGLIVVHDSTPETAPELRDITWVADNFESGHTWHTHNIMEIPEVLLEPHAVLVRAKRLPRTVEEIFENEFMPRVKFALENPESWLNPDTSGDSKDDQIEALRKGSMKGSLRHFVDKIRRPGGKATAAASAGALALILMLFRSSVPYGDSRFSPEQDLEE